MVLTIELKSDSHSHVPQILNVFVSPKQSGQICLLATFLGESGNIFFQKLDFYMTKYFKESTFNFLKSKGFDKL